MKDHRIPKTKNNEEKFDNGEYADIFEDMDPEERKERKDEEEWEEAEKNSNEDKKRKAKLRRFNGEMDFAPCSINSICLPSSEP